MVDEKDGKILVISKYGLTSKRYHETVEDVTWETCTLRNWLNSDFVDEAFSKEEKQRIPTMNIEAGSDPFTNESEGNDTQDQVFLLSVTEVEKYFSSDDAKKCETTLYAKVRNPIREWWLRTPGVDPEPNGAELYVSPYRYQNTFVNDNGIINNGGWTTHDMIVRPAMWIDISSFG